MRIADTEVPSEWTTKVSCTLSPNTVASTPSGPKSTSPIQSAELSPSTAASRSSVVQVPSGWPTRTVVDSAPELATAGRPPSAPAAWTPPGPEPPSQVATESWGEHVCQTV